MFLQDCVLEEHLGDEKQVIINRSEGCMTTLVPVTDHQVWRMWPKISKLKFLGIFRRKIFMSVILV